MIITGLLPAIVVIVDVSVRARIFASTHCHVIELTAFRRDAIFILHSLTSYSANEFPVLGRLLHDLVRKTTFIAKLAFALLSKVLTDLFRALFLRNLLLRDLLLEGSVGVTSSGCLDLGWVVVSSLKLNRPIVTTCSIDITRPFGDV